MNKTEIKKWLKDNDFKPVKDAINSLHKHNKKFLLCEFFSDGIQFRKIMDMQPYYVTYKKPPKAY